MIPVFVDSSFYIALVSPDDRHHPQMARWFDTPGITLITTEYVLIEVANWLANRGMRHVFGRVISRVRKDPLTIILPSSSELFDSGVVLYNSRPDKDWSLTDCISFVVMERHGLTEALTADHHFAQAGFKVLL